MNFIIRAKWHMYNSNFTEDKIVFYVLNSLFFPVVCSGHDADGGGHSH